MQACAAKSAAQAPFAAVAFGKPGFFPRRETCDEAESKKTKAGCEKAWV
jgi:hypothetical protein